MQTARGPTGPASSVPHDGRQRGSATSSLTRLYTLAFTAAAPIYLLWRATSVGTGWQLAISIPFLWIEIWAWLQIVCLRHQVVPPKATEATRRPIRPDDSNSHHTDFDVVVTTGSRSTPADIERTLLGLAASTAIRPITVLTANPDLKNQLPDELTSQLPDLRFTHPTANDAADCLSPVLAYSQSPWVLWLDAGQVPMPNLSIAVEQHLSNERTAVCQIARGLLNPESLVQVARDGDEEALEHELIGPALGQRGRAPWHGPGSLIRRDAIPAISTLDDPTSFNVSWCAIELQRNGWELSYEPTPLIRVPAADSLRPYLSRRRDRSLAIVEQLGYAFSLPNVSWSVRRTALARAVSTTHGLRQLAMVLILVGSLFSGTLPVADRTGAALALVVGYTGAAMLARRSLSGRSMALGDWVRHGWRTLGADLAALVPRLARPVELHRTSRNTDGQTGPAQHGLSGRMQLPIVAFTLLQLALAARAFTVVQPTLLPEMTRSDSLLVIMATTVITVQLIDVLGGLTRPQGRRRRIRVPLKSDITVGDLWGQTLDITPFGVGAIIEAAPPVGATTTATFAVNDIDGTEHIVTAKGVVRSATHHRSGLVRIGLEFTGLDDADRLALTRYCAMGVAGERQGEPGLAENPGRLPMERNTGDLVLVRSLAVASVLSAVGVLFSGPAADPVVAADNRVTAIADSFTVTRPEINQPANTGATTEVDVDVDVDVRLHTDDWSDPLASNDNGNFARPKGPGSWPGPVHLGVSIGPDRLVLPVDETADGITLATITIEDDIDAVELVGPSGRRITALHGQLLIPGNYTIHWASANEPVAASKLVVGQGDVLRVDSTGATVDRTEP